MTIDRDPAANAEDLAALEEWRGRQSSRPTLSDVLETRDGRLIGAYILSVFRTAAAEAVEGHERVKRIRSIVLEMYDGDAQKAEKFLRHRFRRLDRRTPLRRALESEAGAEEVIRFIGQFLYGDESIEEGGDR